MPGHPPRHIIGPHHASLINALDFSRLEVQLQSELDKAGRITRSSRRYVQKSPPVGRIYLTHPVELETLLRRDIERIRIHREKAFWKPNVEKVGYQRLRARNAILGDDLINLR